MIQRIDSYELFNQAQASEVIEESEDEDEDYWLKVLGSDEEKDDDDDEDVDEDEDEDKDEDAVDMTHTDTIEKLLIFSSDDEMSD